MFFNPLSWLFSAITIISFLPFWVYAEVALTDVNTSDLLIVKPDKCVALREGRQCLTDVKFSWKTVEQGNYCLLEQSKLTVIHCWEHASAGHYTLAFAKQKTTQFLLVLKGTTQAVTTAEVEVSWVYKTKHKKRRWRLF